MSVKNTRMQVYHDVGFNDNCKHAYKIKVIQVLASTQQLSYFSPKCFRMSKLACAGWVGQPPTPFSPGMVRAAPSADASYDAHNAPRARAYTQKGRVR